MFPGPLLSPGPPLTFMCEVHLSVMLVPNTYAGDRPPGVVPEGRERTGGRVETGQGWCGRGEHETGKHRIPLES